MVRSVRHWIRVVTPAEYVLVVVLVLWCVHAWIAVVRNGMGERDAWESTFSTFAALLLVSAGVYAFVRAAYFHPIEHRKYGRWLATTPWRFPQQLPLGPMTLVWQDVLIVGVLTVLVPQFAFDRLIVPVVFLFAYSVAQAGMLCRVQTRWPLYVVLFLVGCAVLTLSNIWFEVLIAILTYAAAHAGIHQLLRRLPFDHADRERLMPVEINRDCPERLVRGWPVPPQSTERWSWCVSHRTAALVGVLVCWLYVCVGYQLQGIPRFSAGMSNAATSIATAVALVRIAIYVVGFVPPITLLGRLATGRLIIPGYDVVFAAPLAVLLIAWVMVDGGASAGIPPLIYGPAAAGVAVWLALALPPRREVWQLTGHHRIAYRFKAALVEQNSSSRRLS